MIISIFTPHGGCPERCRFCDQKVSGGEPVSARGIQARIEAHLATHLSSPRPSPRRNGRIEIAFYGGTFTAMPERVQLEYLEAARPYLDRGTIEAVRISTRPDALSESWLKRLKEDYRLETVELGAQSFRPKVLEELGRSHSVASIEEGVRLLRKLSLRVGLHLMLGCPGEESDDDENTVVWLKRLAPEFVRLHPLLVLEGTELASRHRRGEFQPIDLESAVGRAARIVGAVETKATRFIKLGLQANELLGTAVVAGPYHPGFGDLVRRRVLSQMRASA